MAMQASYLGQAVRNESFAVLFVHQARRCGCLARVQAEAHVRLARREGACLVGVGGRNLQQRPSRPRN